MNRNRKNKVWFCWYLFLKIMFNHEKSSKWINYFLSNALRHLCKDFWRPVFFPCVADANWQVGGGAQNVKNNQVQTKLPKRHRPKFSIVLVSRNDITSLVIWVRNSQRILSEIRTENKCLLVMYQIWYPLNRKIQCIDKCFMIFFLAISCVIYIWIENETRITEGFHTKKLRKIK